jgi:hypothetical protein
VTPELSDSKVRCTGWGHVYLQLCIFGVSSVFVGVSIKYRKIIKPKYCRFEVGVTCSDKEIPLKITPYARASLLRRSTKFE